MKKKKNLPETIKHTIDNLKDLNPQHLKQTMLKEMYVLEAGLFNQAQLESKRISHLRELTKTIEHDLFSPENLQELTLSQKMVAYKLISENLQSSLGFSMDLHKTVGNGLEVVAQIEQQQYEQDQLKTKKVKQVATKKDIQDLKKLIISRAKSKK